MTVRVIPGNCLEQMKALHGEGVRVDSVVTDPPYHLTSIVRRYGKPDAAPTRQGRAANATGAYARATAGFMGKTWDGGDIAMRPETWSLAYDLLKPGGWLVCFAATRTQHRIACAIEDAGFEIRDMIAWIYGSGFPKSHNQHGDWEGWGTALKPALEPITLARKPLAGTVAENLARHGTGALNIDGCRIETTDDLNGGAYAASGSRGISPSLHAGSGMNQPGKTTGRDFEQPIGRWPANVVQDGSAEVVEHFPREAGASAPVQGTEPSAVTRDVYAERGRVPGAFHADSGSAARFFYCAKADGEDRAGSKHPTVKPVSLMRWLVRLVTPPRGLVLDPFAGTGTTGEAADREGMSCVLIEREEEYVQAIRHRLGRASGADAPLFASASPPEGQRAYDEAVREVRKRKVAAGELPAIPEYDR